MVEVVGVDHLVVSVGDFEKSKKFYAPLMEFLGFGVDTEYEGMMGWANGNTLFWIAAVKRARNTNTARAISGFTITRSACAIGRTSTRFRLISRRTALPSSIRPASITTTIMRCSSSTPTA